MKKVLIILAITAIICTTCYYDSEEYLYPEINNTCDTVNVTFSVTISDMLGNHCLSCHSNTTAAGFGSNIRLEDYADVKSRSQDVLGSIKHESGYSPMPKSAAKLDDCLIKQFEIWIQDGMPDN